MITVLTFALTLALQRVMTGVFINLFISSLLRLHPPPSFSFSFPTVSQASLPLFPPPSPPCVSPFLQMLLSSDCCSSFTTCCLHHFISLSPTLLSPVTSAEPCYEKKHVLAVTFLFFCYSCSLSCPFRIFEFHAVIQKSLLLSDFSSNPLHFCVTRASQRSSHHPPPPPPPSLYLLLLLHLFPSLSFLKSCCLVLPHSASPSNWVIHWMFPWPRNKLPSLSPPTPLTPWLCHAYKIRSKRDISKGTWRGRRVKKRRLQRRGGEAEVD